MSYRLTITYRAVQERANGSNSTLREVQPGRVMDLTVENYYVRDGGLFYRTGENAGAIDHMVPLDLLYHYGAAKLEES